MEKIFDRLIDILRGKRACVLGLGVSNLPLAHLLVEFDVCASITVYDKKSPEELGEGALELQARGVEFSTDFESIDGDIIFRSPGLRPDMAGISRATERGAVLTSEIEKVLSLAPCKTFALTGSDGKTTSTTLTGLFLSEAGKCFVGGNIGTPLLSKLGEMLAEDSVVLELSSFQLMHTEKSPLCAAITNITDNHMDWHKSVAEYENAKFSIVGENTKRVVLNLENTTTRDFGERLLSEGGREMIFFSSKRTELPASLSGAKLVCIKDGYITLGKEKLLALSDINIPGVHNIENFMTAIALTYGYLDREAYSRAARGFFGVEHRLELVRRLGGVEYFNSSIDSSPTRTIAALSALHGRDIVVICGGYDKKLDYAPLARALCAEVRAVVLTGATGPKIKQELLTCPDYSPERLTVCECESFEGAVECASALARDGGVVLLSPASASFDMFRNFAERGEYFKALVNKM